MFLCRSSPAPPPHTGVIPRCRGDALAFFHMSVNCTPAKGCVWPVIAPAQAFVRAGAVLRGFAFLSRRFAIGSWLALQFCRGVLPRPMAGLAVLLRRFASVHARLCVPVAALCHRLMAGLAVLSPRFAIGSWLALRFCRRALPSAHGWPCGSVAALCHRLTPVFFLLEEKETACDSLRSCSAGSRSPFAHSPVLARLSAFGGFTLGLCAFLYGDPDGSTTGVRLYEKKRRIGWALLSLWIYDSS